MTEQTQKHLNQLLTGVADGRQLQVSQGASWLDVALVTIVTFVADPHRFRLKPEDEVDEVDEVPDYLDYDELGDPGASRELRDDEEWSGQGHWLVADLPSGYRPLLVGEVIQTGDDVCCVAGPNRRSGVRWEPAVGLVRVRVDTETTSNGGTHEYIARTKRPMPAPKRIPFTYETAVANGLLGEVVAQPLCRGHHQAVITELTPIDMLVGGRRYSYADAAEYLTFLNGDPVAYRA